MTPNLQSSATLPFLNHLGNLLLPGSVTPCVPRWDAEEPSQHFLTEVAKFAVEIESFRHSLSTRFNQLIVELQEEDIQACIAENTPATRIFFQTVGDLFIHEYYSRPKNLLALGLPMDPPFPIGNKPDPGNLEKLEVVYLQSKPYR